jgi:uncharacterized delta-60 repeat protein
MKLLLFLALAIVAAVTSGVNAQPAGALDTSFNGTGYIDALLVTGTDSRDDARGMALQADGKIVLAGLCNTPLPNAKLCLARLRPDGTLDPSFDGPGPNGTGRGNGRGKFLLDLPAGGVFSTSAPKLAVQANGKIVVAANCSPPGVIGRFCLARLLEDGSYDASFNGPSADGLGEGQGAGRFVLPSIGDSPIFEDEISEVLVHPGGRIVAAGRCRNADGLFQFCLARLNSNGSFDRSFTGPNNAQGRFVVASLTGSLSSHTEVLQAALLQTDGKLLIAGYCDSNDASLRFMCVARLLDDGRFDSSFGEPISGGIRRGAAFFSADANRTTAASMALQPDGNLLLAGTCRLSQSAITEDMCVARLTKAGDPDPLFAYPYAPVTAVRRLLPVTSGESSTTVQAISQADGQWIIAGNCDTPGFNGRLCFARYSADGIELDRAFADGSASPPDMTKFLIPGAASVQMVASILQPDGKLVILGECNYPGSALLPNESKFCLARIHTGALAGRECSLDIDGDGRINALTDGLINTRIALGLTGNAVTNGVQFAANAQRSNWPSIRNYLVSRCEMRLP